jgi:predicted RNase H-like HicB family nuclease
MRFFPESRILPGTRFLMVIEKAGKNFSAYSPDLPGCVATGKTCEKTEERMHEAIGMHIRGLIEKWFARPEIPFVGTIRRGPG